MQAWVIRPDRLGDPEQAMKLESIEVPEPGPGEVLVRVMAAGAQLQRRLAKSLGIAVSISVTPATIHIAGSDASGASIGWAGRHPLEAGDEVVIIATRAAGDARGNGLDPMACSRQKIWAYESNWGSFASTARCRPSSCCQSRPR